MVRKKAALGKHILQRESTLSPSIIAARVSHRMPGLNRASSGWILHIMNRLSTRGQAPYIALYEGHFLKKGGGARVHKGQVRVSDYVHNWTGICKSFGSTMLWDPAPV